MPAWLGPAVMTGIGALGGLLGDKGEQRSTTNSSVFDYRRPPQVVDIFSQLGGDPFREMMIPILVNHILGFFPNKGRLSGQDMEHPVVAASQRGARQQSAERLADFYRTPDNRPRKMLKPLAGRGPGSQYSPFLE